MTTAESEMRAASDTFLASLERLSNLESEKRALSPDDPRLVELANEVESLTADVLRLANIQSHLAETAHVMTMTEDPEAPTKSISSSPRSPHDILEEWREAERTLAAVDPASTEAADAFLRAHRLRVEYQRAYQDKRRDDRTK